jgi:hypothetical protein
VITTSWPAGPRLVRYGRTKHPSDGSYRLHAYAPDPRADSYGAEAAEALTLPPQQVFKTLVAELGGRLMVAVVPVSATTGVGSRRTRTGREGHRGSDRLVSTRARVER